MTAWPQPTDMWLSAVQRKRAVIEIWRMPGLGHLQSLVDDRFGAVRLGLLRGHESSSHRRDQA